MAVRFVSITPDAEDIIAYCARVSSPQNQNKDGKRLLRYCVRHGHWSPFEMAHMVLEIETTRGISAQILRHRSFSFQEFSQRYACVGKEPWMPDMRLAGATNRQSSLPVNWNEATKEQLDALKDGQEAIRTAWAAYQDLIEAGFAPETARFVLPLSTPTRLYMAGSIRSWLHYVDVRCTEDTQVEHRDIAEEVKEILRKRVPVILEAFENRTDGNG